MRNSKRNTNKHTIAALVGASMIAANVLYPVNAEAATKSFPSEKVIKVIQQTKAQSNPQLKPVNAKIYLDGKQIPLNDRVMISNYRTYLPLRSLATYLGKNIDWNQQYKVALLEDNGTTYELPLWRHQAVKDGEKTITIDEKNPNTVVAIYRNKTYLPLRFESEILGYEITYFDTDKAACLEIHLTTPGKQAPTKPTNPKPAKPSTPTPSTKPTQKPSGGNSSIGNTSSDGWDPESGTSNGGNNIPGAGTAPEPPANDTGW